MIRQLHLLLITLLIALIVIDRVSAYSGYDDDDDNDDDDDDDYDHDDEDDCEDDDDYFHHKPIFVVTETVTLGNTGIDPTDILLPMSRCHNDGLVDDIVSKTLNV